MEEEFLNKLIEEIEGVDGLSISFLGKLSSVDGREFNRACIIPKLGEKEYTSFEIQIENDLSILNKIDAIHHELGHYKLCKELGQEKVNLLITKPNDNRKSWTQKTEFHAFYNQLEKSKEAFDKGLTSLLPITIENINSSYEGLNNKLPNITAIELSYKAAIELLFEKQLWKECNNRLV